MCVNVISDGSSHRHKIFLGVSGAYGWSCGLAHGLVLFQGVSYVESRARAAYSLATWSMKGKGGLLLAVYFQK